MYLHHIHSLQRRIGYDMFFHNVQKRLKRVRCLRCEWSHFSVQISTVFDTATGLEPASSAALGRQRKRSNFTPPRLWREKKAWRAFGKNRNTAFCRNERSQGRTRYLGHAFGMGTLSGFKGLSLIAGLVLPHAINDAHPNVCQSTNRHAVSLALSTFVLVVGSRPRFTQGRLPSELVQIVAQGLQAGKAFVRFGIIAALEGDGSRPSQRLDAIGIGITSSIIAPFSEQSRSQAASRTRKRTPEFMVR